jgi:hypothetical protein
MVDAALQEFWRLLGLPSLPAGENDQSIEIEGIGRILVARRVSTLTLSGFLSTHPGQHDGLAAHVMGLSDYRNRSGARHLHPVFSASGDWGLLVVLRQENLTGHDILQAFETLCSALERIENRLKS